MWIAEGLNIENLPHLLDAAVDRPGAGGVLRSDVLDQGPGQHIGGGTFYTNRGYDNCAIALGGFMVLLDELLDPGSLSGPAGVSQGIM